MRTRRRQPPAALKFSGGAHSGGRMCQPPPVRSTPERNRKKKRKEKKKNSHFHHHHDHLIDEHDDERDRRSSREVRELLLSSMAPLTHLRRKLCRQCNVETSDMKTHQLSYHVNTIAVPIADNAWVTLERMGTGFFRCPVCLLSEFRDARLVKVNSLPPCSATTTKGNG